MSKSAKLVWGILIATFVIMSLIPYGERTNPPVDEKLALKAPKDVDAIFKRACYDCHSNQTKWPWYSYVFPLSWSIKDHVKVGRARLNFDKWYSYSEEKRLKLRDGIFRKTGTIMPLVEYVLFHSEAKLSKEDIKKVRDWASEGKGYVDTNIR
jgi:hypothetical protein